MILISKTYTIVTEESAQGGESSDSGFVFENGEYTFKELVSMFEDEFTNCSCVPASGNINEWFTSDSEMDMFSGEYEHESIHYSRDNLPRSEKYWKKAMLFAGIKGVK